jgi:hypothetical protein
MRYDIRYKHVEIALSMLHVVPAGGEKTFRSRLRHFRKVGVPDLPKVGSGRQIAYTPDQVDQLFLALELAEFDVDPVTIARLVLDDWKSLRLLLRAAREASPRRYLAFAPMLMSAGWSDKLVLRLNSYTRDELMTEMFGQEDDPAGEGNPLFGRAAVIDLTGRLARLDREIEEAVYIHR